MMPYCRAIFESGRTRPESTTATGVTNDSAVWGAYALRLFALFAAPLVVATVVYGPYLGEYFALDDWIWLGESSDGSLWTVVVRAFTFPGADDFSGPTPFFRPLADVAFKVQYDAFGMRPEAFHMLNLSVHALVCVGYRAGSWSG